MCVCMCVLVNCYGVSGNRRCPLYPTAIVRHTGADISVGTV